MGGALDAAVGFLADQPLALLFLLLAGGSALGSVRVLGVQAGPAAVLFASNQSPMPCLLFWDAAFASSESIT